jgi:hypothetical protein
VAPGEIEVHPDQMAAQGAGIRSAAGQAQGLNASLQQELAGAGQPFGTDLVGSLVGACYGVISGAATEAFTSNAAGLDDHGARVQVMAAEWQQAENTNVANAGSVGRALG